MPNREEVLAWAQALRTLGITAFDDLSVELIDQQYRTLAQDYKSKGKDPNMLLEAYELVRDGIGRISQDPAAFSKLKEQLTVQGAKLQKLVEEKQVELRSITYPEPVKAAYLDVSDEQESPQMIEFIKILYGNTEIDESKYQQLLSWMKSMRPATFKNLESSFELLQRINQLNFKNHSQKLKLIGDLTYVQMSLVAKSAGPRDSHATLEQALILLHQADPEHFRDNLKEHVYKDIDLSVFDLKRDVLISALKKTGLYDSVFKNTTPSQSRGAVQDERAQTSPIVTCPASVKTEYLRPNGGEKSVEEQQFIETLYGNTVIDDEKYSKLLTFISRSMMQGIKDSRYLNPEALSELFMKVQKLDFGPHQERKIEIMGQLLRAQHMLAFRRDMADESVEHNHSFFKNALFTFYTIDTARFSQNIRKYVFDYTNPSLDLFMKNTLMKALRAKNLEVSDPTPTADVRNRMQELRTGNAQPTNTPKSRP